MTKNNLINKLEELKIETKYAPYIHHVDISSSIEQIAHNLLTAKEIGVTYIYDLKGTTGLYWEPKGRFLFNNDVNSIDDVYIFITGMSKNEYASILFEKNTNMKR